MHQVLTKVARFALLAVALLLMGQSLPLALSASSLVPTVPVGLLVTIAPPELPADSGSYAAVFVSLVDSGGLPTIALSQTNVVLSSSLTNIASIPDSIVIPPGAEYAVATVTTTDTPGTTQITAQSTGLASPVASQLKTVTPSGFPSKLRIIVSPTEFLPRSDSGQIWVELLDDANQPAKAISDVPVNLATSNSSIASLSSGSLTVTITAGSLLSNVGSFTTSGSGLAVITGTSVGYSSGSATVTVDNPAICITSCGPSALLLRVLPETLPTDGQSYTVLEVSLATSEDRPAVSSTATQVLLTSDKPTVASVPGDNGAIITIPANQISVLAAVKTSALAGTANITATAAPGQQSENLLPKTVAVYTQVPAPSKLQAYVAPPSTAFSSSSNNPILVVQLWGSDNPARARQDTSVTITSSNASIIGSQISLTIPKGKDYVTTSLQIKGVGTTTLRISSQGLESSGATITSVPGPLVVSLSAASPFIFSNQTDLFTFTASFEGMPLTGLNVTWTTTAGSLTPPTSLTGPSGAASSYYVPRGSGAFNITASAHSIVAGNIINTYTLQVLQTPVPPQPSFIQFILGYWYYIAAAVVVAGAAGYYVFRLRRKKQRAEIEAGFEAV